MSEGIHYDESQQRVIAAQGGSHLVLAPPGCGKTQILTERIRVAHDAGVAFDEMLCLTFTNRAARGMMERIAHHLQTEDVAALYVGNVHRFCSKFLFANGLVEAESAVIDDDDAISILANFYNEDEGAVMQSYKRRQEYFTVLHLSNFMEQIRHAHPRNLRIHPECINTDDIAAMRKLCALQKRAFTADAMIDIYDRAEAFHDALNSSDLDYGQQRIVLNLLRKMSLARNYSDYKRQHHLLDFQELLLRTYDALTADTEGHFKRYRWIQVDEVQDLNALQLAIIDLLTAPDCHTIMFLGDEQQAIFSFMGAKMETLDMLKRRCSGHIHHLAVNHRSPKYLLDTFNAYATQVLHIDASLLPQTFSHEESKGGELSILRSPTEDTEVQDVVDLAVQLNAGSGSTAIIVNANSDAEVISHALRLRGQPHFKVSGTDLFSLPEMKLLLAHLGVLACESSFMPWARIMRGMHVFESNAASRKFVRALLDRAILPSDLILHDAPTTYVQQFRKAIEEREVVVFDTETTGLDVFHDDIVQIAAVKLRGGHVVPGSAFSVFIATSRPIPQFLGDVENPIIEELRHHELLKPAEALRRFLAYAQGSVLLGHNSDYDYNILRFNLQRHCPEVSLPKLFPCCFDTLRLVRLLEPGLKAHKLKYLLAALHLEGTNSHLADDDVNATCSVVAHCYRRACAIEPEQQQYLSDKRVQSRAQRLRQNYGDFFMQGRAQLCKPFEGSQPQLVGELKNFYEALQSQGLILPIDHIPYVFDYLSAQLSDTSHEPLLAQQLANHLMEISTLKEADLCGSPTMSERLFVSTIHKAKGLEFDNVIVFDAVEGRLPNFNAQYNDSQLAEDARKFYVAITRAKRRLIVAQSLERTDRHNVRQERHLTRFMQPIAQRFAQMYDSLFVNTV